MALHKVSRGQNSRQQYPALQDRASVASSSSRYEMTESEKGVVWKCDHDLRNVTESNADSPQLRICQNHRRFSLSFRYLPIVLQKPLLLREANHSEPILLVKVDRPPRIPPSSDQNRIIRQPPQMSQQLRSNPALLPAAPHIRVSDESHILDLLNAHNAH